MIAGLLAAVTSYGQASPLAPFEDCTSTSGIAFVHHPGRSTDRLMPEVMGSGVVLADFDRSAVADINRDGLLDSGSTNFQNETTALYLQLRDLYSEKRPDALGVGRSARARLSFGMDFSTLTTMATRIFSWPMGTSTTT